MKRATIEELQKSQRLLIESDAEKKVGSFKIITRSERSFQNLPLPPPTTCDC